MPKYDWWTQVGELVKEYVGPSAILSGHHHTLQIGNADGVPYYVGGALGGAKWPASVDPTWRHSGYVIAHMREDSFTPTYAAFGIQDHLDIIGPAEGADAEPRGPLELTVAAYSSVSIESMRYRLGDGPWMSLAGPSRINIYDATIAGDELPEGDLAISVVAQLQNGESLTASRNVQVVPAGQLKNLYQSNFFAPVDIEREGLVAINGDWSFRNGVLHGTVEAVEAFTGEDWAYLVPGGPTSGFLGLQEAVTQSYFDEKWVDYEVSAYMLLVTGGAGVVAGWSTPVSGYYSFTIEPDGRAMIAKHDRNGIITEVLCVDRVEAFSRIRPHVLSLSTVGPTLRAYIDGQLFHESVLDSSLSGRFALTARPVESGSAWFMVDRLYVTRSTNVLQDNSQLPTCKTGQISDNFPRLGKSNGGEHPLQEFDVPVKTLGDKFTASMWINVQENSPEPQYLLQRDDLTLSLVSGNLHSVLGDGGFERYTFGFVKEFGWQHLTVVKDGDSLMVYLNGILRDRAGLNGFKRDFPDDSSGLAGANNYFNMKIGGNLDELRLYGRALDQVAIIENMRSGVPLDTPVATPGNG